MKESTPTAGTQMGSEGWAAAMYQSWFPGVGGLLYLGKRKSLSVGHANRYSMTEY